MPAASSFAGGNLEQEESTRFLIWILVNGEGKKEGRESRSQTSNAQALDLWIAGANLTLRTAQLVVQKAPCPSRRAGGAESASADTNAVNDIIIEI